MADPKSFASTYAVASTDKDTLNKRRDLASRLFQAKQAGKTMEEAITSESGVDIRNLQKGSVDTKMGTGLTEEEVAGFAERLYAGKYGGQSATPTTAQGSGSVFDQQEKVARAAAAASGAFGGPNSKGASSQSQVYTPRLDKLAAMQSSPFGSTSSFGQSRPLGSRSNLSEPKIKTQAYREQQAALGQQTEAMNQEALDMKKKELEFKKTMLENARKEASSPTGFSSSTMAYFGGVQK